MHPDNVVGDRNERDDRYQEAWPGFAPGRWQEDMDVRDFIQRNVSVYLDDAGFLSEATARTR